jgi:hypothetical protein
MIQAPSLIFLEKTRVSNLLAVEVEKITDGIDIRDLGPVL